MTASNDFLTIDCERTKQRIEQKYGTVQQYLRDEHPTVPASQVYKILRGVDASGVRSQEYLLMLKNDGMLVQKPGRKSSYAGTCRGCRRRFAKELSVQRGTL